MNKKVCFIVILLLILFVVSIPLTIAYIKVTTNTDNIITFGSLKMKLTEYEIIDGKKIIINDNNSINISDKSNINRLFIIENMCKHPMFVRISFDIKGIDNINDLILIENNSDNWIYKDGWYYYKNILNSKQITPELNIELAFNIEKIKEKYSGEKIDLKIKAEALQSKNNSNYVLDAKGWPS